MTTTLEIELTDEERELLQGINFDGAAVRGPEQYRANGDKVVALWRSLDTRSALPPHRLRYFSDPAYFIGGHGSSRREWFERNGTSGEDILRHGNFLHHLRYMVFGPDLPGAVIAQFQRAVVDCGTITSGDLIPLSKTAKSLAREHRLDKRANEAFFQLALEFGMSPDQARYVRDAVGQL